MCVCVAPSLSQSDAVSHMRSRFSGIKRARGSFLKQMPSLKRTSSLVTPNSVTSTATPTPVGVSTGRGFVFQKGVARPSTGSDQVSSCISITMIIIICCIYVITWYILYNYDIILILCLCVNYGIKLMCMLYNLYTNAIYILTDCNAHRVVCTEIIYHKMFANKNHVNCGIPMTLCL